MSVPLLTSTVQPFRSSGRIPLFEFTEKIIFADEIQLVSCVFER